MVSVLAIDNLENDFDFDVTNAKWSAATSSYC